MKVIVPTLLFVSLVLSSSFAQLSLAVPPPTPAPVPAPPSFCDSKCAVRCSKAGRQDRCLKDCGICCRACNCVPSGTYGNKSECPCYRDKMSSKGTPKCP